MELRVLFVFFNRFTYIYNAFMDVLAGFVVLHYEQFYPEAALIFASQSQNSHLASYKYMHIVHKTWF
jgi:hypothetical protein